MLISHPTQRTPEYTRLHGRRNKLCNETESSPSTQCSTILRSGSPRFPNSYFSASGLFPLGPSENLNLQNIRLYLFAHDYCGTGTGSVAKMITDNHNELLISFDFETLYIQPQFLGLHLPPFLKIDIVPKAFQGTINQESRKFMFSAATPLMMKTILTSEESKGDMKSTRGELHAGWCGNS
ncbi:hypothetical protein PIB30_101558 [Stylosanthes scabra]|uniref:Uncharacterized protein n=1 Tax=Stylosanthes scabra TaxID=79078 RepID=A0ABU6ZW75_9FABA|nr:hypothetical protein [Stylosanthes scabra]